MRLLKMRRVGLACVALLAGGFSACSSGSGGGGTGPPPPKDYTYRVVNAFENLSFTRPVDLQYAPDQSDRIFVVEQRGRILVFPNDANAQIADMTTFLDIEARVDDSDNEEGLLSLAFAPDYETSGVFYLYYNDAVQPNRTQIVRYNVSADADVAVDNPFVVFDIVQPRPNHNGGALRFGPDDGYLYLGLGDGGGSNDPDGNGQNRANLLGTVIRIDVNGTQGPLNYAIPPDNPFVGNANGWREEIWAWGLRNPWRMSFDPVTGLLWLGDVGQWVWEEIDIIEKGGNYGWVTMEGNVCVQANCDQTGLEKPIWVYEHVGGANRAITGGYVYRGAALRGLVGAYIYADYLSGEIWALRYDGSTATNELIVDSALQIASFGLDQAGEIYVCAFNGSIYRLEETAVGGEQEGSD